MYLALRTETFAKLFFLISCTGLFLYAVLAFYTFHTAFTTLSQAPKPQDFTINIPELDIQLTTEVQLDNDLKYILFWTNSINDPALNLPEGQQIFTDHKCDYANCFITTNKTLTRNDYTKFDAIVFNISVIKNWKKLNMPQKRSQKQKYVFYSLLPSSNTPVCVVNADNYFNWTWTYRLDSDIVSPFIEVTDLKGNVIAPKLNMTWSTNNHFEINDQMNPVIRSKRKTMVLIMGKCNSGRKRKVFIRELQAEFKMYLLDFDIYGCDNLQCPSGDCAQVIKKYHFNLIYEDSLSEDYVTKAVIKAYNHGAIPIIFGGTDYRKFLPEGSYIKVQSLTADHIAAKIGYIMKNPFLYHSYFNWKKTYSIRETEDLKGICDLCANLNDNSKFGKISVYKNFRNWWHPGPLYDKCIPKGAENLSEVLSYINNTANLK